MLTLIYCKAHLTDAFFFNSLVPNLQRFKMDPSCAWLANPEKVGPLFDVQSGNLPCWCEHQKNRTRLKICEGRFHTLLLSALPCLHTDVISLLKEYLMACPDCFGFARQFFDWNAYDAAFMPEKQNAQNEDVVETLQPFAWDSQVRLHANLAIVCDSDTDQQAKEELLKYLLFRRLSLPDICLVRSSCLDLEDILPACFVHEGEGEDSICHIVRRRYEMTARNLPINSIGHDTVIIHDGMSQNHATFYSNKHYKYGNWILGPCKMQFIDWLVIKRSDQPTWVTSLYHGILKNRLPDRTLSDWIRDIRTHDILWVDMHSRGVYFSCQPPNVPPFRLDQPHGMFDVAKAIQLKRSRTQASQLSF